MNRGYCDLCGRLVPATPTEREGRIFLAKRCPECGTSEALVASDARRYNDKRKLDTDFEYNGCSVNCLACKHKKPNIVIVDVTNRCNQCCPICINSTPKMGFLFEPPLEYFDKVFSHYATLDPPPYVQLFGGEPTVREDLFDIIALAQSYGLPLRLLTNGLKLADKEYCRRIVATGVRILLSYDGDHPEMYRTLRNSDTALALKHKAFENLREVGGANVTLMTLAVKGFNDHAMGDLLRFCHERRDFIKGIYFMPITHNWDPMDLPLEPDRTTGEDVEGSVDDAFPDDRVDFVPAAFLGQLPTVVKHLGIKPPSFAGAHPNCESMYLLLSDGEQYRPLAYYLRSSTGEFARALLEVEKRLARRDQASRADRAGRPPSAPTLAGKIRRMRATLTLAGTLLRHGRPSRFLRGRGPAKALHGLLLAGKLLFGRSARDALASHLTIRGVLHLIVLPFEDKTTVETDRLERCPGGFSFWDPSDDQVKHIPVCAWAQHKTHVLREITAYYTRESLRAVPEPALVSGTR